MGFDYGNAFGDPKIHTYYVRCLRGGPATVPTYTVPGAPTIGTATAGNAQATITFTAPTSNGGSPITVYTVTSSPGGITKTEASSPITVTGLTNGTAYTFTVTATNSVGTGPASSPSKSVTPVAPTTAQIASYMSTAYQVEQTALADDIKGIKAQAAADGNLLSGATLLKILKAKPPHVQHFVDTSLQYIQTIKTTDSIDKQAIVSLFSNYKAQDLTQIPSLVNRALPALSQATINACISASAVIPAINNIYALAIAQLNAM